MIVRVWEQAAKTGIGPVIVACGDEEIYEAIKKVGGLAVMTDPDHASGSDRVYEAITKFDPTGKYNIVINLQGDMPTINPIIIKRVLDPFYHNSSIDIATIASVIKTKKELRNEAVVKCVASIDEITHIGRAIYFSRNIAPYGEGDYYHHQGVYAYTRWALAKYVSFKPTILEQREKLEQLRALENGLKIDVALVDETTIGVDTEKELKEVRKLFK